MFERNTATDRRERNGEQNYEWRENNRIQTNSRRLKAQLQKILRAVAAADNNAMIVEKEAGGDNDI